jgi:hypothetical protein
MIQISETIFGSIPGLDGLVQDLINATTEPYQITARQGENIVGGLDRSAFKKHDCFRNPLQG